MDEDCFAGTPNLFPAFALSMNLGAGDRRLL
jgi:hypothetical protein